MGLGVAGESWRRSLVDRLQCAKGLWPEVCDIYEEHKQSLCVWRVETNSEAVSNEAGAVGRVKSCRGLAPVRVFINLLKAMGNQ